MIATILTYPFDIMRTQFALQGSQKFHNSFHSYATYTFKTFGLRGFYYGLWPAVVGITPYVGLNFGLYEGFKSFFETSNAVQLSNSKLNLIKVGLISGMAGGISKMVVYPLVRQICKQYFISFLRLLHRRIQ